MFQILLRSVLASATLAFLIPGSANGQSKPARAPVQDSTTIATSYAPLQSSSGPHPDFILPSIEGNEVIQLSQHRGKKVLLLHFASW